MPPTYHESPNSADPFLSVVIHMPVRVLLQTKFFTSFLNCQTSLWLSSSIFLLFFIFPHFYNILAQMRQQTQENCKKDKNNILNCEQGAQHPFVGPNIQEAGEVCKNSSSKSLILKLMKELQYFIFLYIL